MQARRIGPGLLAVAAMLGMGAAPAWAGAPVTTLAVTSGGTAVTTVAQGAVVTLTATVKSGPTTPVTLGTVLFCNASATYCSDINIYGSAQLTSNGTATFSFVPSIGSFSFKAVFAGTVTYVGSSSSASPLTVTGTYPTTSVLTATQTATAPPLNLYTLSDTVTSNTALYPSGIISFQDSSNGNYVLGTQALTDGTTSFGLKTLSAATILSGTQLPRYEATGDFNGDGKPDIAIANFLGNNLAVYLGNGDGTFNYKATLTTGSSPQFIVVGDFNGDGKLDLATANYSSATLSVFLGAGDGTFTTVGSPTTGASFNGPGGISIGDFNRDGKLDLVVTNQGNNNGTNSVVLFGNGDGTFTGQSGTLAGVYPYFTAVADFNGDGYPDLAICNRGGAETPPVANSVSIFLGTSAGTFGAPSNISIPGAATTVIAADFNQDGKVDLALADSTVNTVTILKGNGDGTFTAQPALTTQSSPLGMGLGDFNGDGLPDLVVTNSGSNTLSLFLNTSTAGGSSIGFAAISTNPATGGNPLSLAVADFNGDGKADVVVGNFSDSTYTIYLSQYTTTSTAQIAGVSVTGVTPTNPHLADAVFPAGATYSASTSNTQALTAAVLNETIALTDLNAPSTTYGQQVSLQATLSPYDSQGYSTDGEKVTFYLGGTTSLGQIALAGGVATLNTTTLPAGADSLTVKYTSDGNYAAATSSPAVVHTVYNVDTITVTSPASSPSAATYSSGGTVSITASSTSGQPIAYATTSPTVCSVSSAGVVTTLSTGTCTITLNQAAAGNYAAASQVTQVFNIGAGTNTITFPALANTAIGATPPVPAATATSGVAPTYTSSTASVCTVTSAGAITDLTPGTCTITAAQGATGNYAAATSVSQSFQVTPLADAIAVASPASPDSVSYTSGGTVAISASSTSGQPLTYTTSSAACTVSSSGLVAEVATGSCVVTVSQPAAGNYAAATPQTVTINIGAGTNTITFPALANTAIGATPPVPAATATSGVAPTYTSSTASVCTVTSAGAITDLAPGTCTITAAQGATGNYAAATSVSRSYQITPLADTITVTSPASSPSAATYSSGGTVSIAASSTSGQPIAYATTSPTVCSVSSAGVVTTLSTGTCTITLNQAAAGNYAAASQVTQVLNIGAGTNTITFPALANTAIGATPPVPAATATSGVAPTYTSSTASVCTVTSAGAITDLTPGTCTITAAQGATGNYAAATSVSQSFQVTPLADTITVTSPASPDSVSYTSGGTVAISASSTSGQPLTYTTSSAACTVSAGGLVAEVATGSCVVTVSQPAAGNYAAATPQTVTINIGAGTNTITFPALTNTPAGATAPVPAATSTAGGTILYASTTPSVCTVSGGTITDVAPGTCTITANEAATGNYAAAAQQTQSYQVTPLADVITIPGTVSGSATVGGTVSIGATATSGVMPTYTSTTPAVCSVSVTGVVTTLATGSCSITVSQAAAGNYSAATPQTVTIAVTGQPQTIQNFGSAITATFGGAAPLLAATATSGLAPAYTATGPACSVTASGTVTILAAGSCQIIASQPGNSTYAAATQVSETLTVNPEADVITIPGTVPGSATAGGTVSIGATTTSGVPPSYTSTTPAICTVSASGVVTTLVAGTCSVSVTQPAAGNFAAATPKSVTIAVGGQTQTIQNFGSPITATFGSAPPTLAATATSGLAPTYTATGPACSVTASGTVTVLAAGSCQIVASQAGNGTYAAATQVSETLTVNPAADAIAIPSSVPSTAIIGATVSIGATTTSGMVPTYNSTTPAVCSVSATGVVTTIASGTCSITVAQAAAGNYAAATPQTVSIVVSGGVNTISFAPLANTPFTSVPPVLSASATSGQPVTYSASTAACTVTASGVVTFNSIGTCTITANQAATGSYAAASPVSQSFQITPGADTILVPASVPTNAAPGTPVSIGATSTTSGPITYVSATPAVCTVTSPGGVVTLLTTGTCTITLSQPASGNFAAAPAQTINLNVYDFTIAANTPTGQTVVPGGAATYTYALAPLGGQYPGSMVTYTVAGLPPAATYTLTPATGTVTQMAGPQTLTLTVTTAQTAATNRLRQQAPWTLALLLPLFLRRKARLKLARPMLLLLLLAGAALSMTGCAAPNGFFGQSPANYSITVTASSGNVTHSAAPVTLNVQ